MSRVQKLLKLISTKTRKFYSLQLKMIFTFTTQENILLYQNPQKETRLVKSILQVTVYQKIKFRRLTTKHLFPKVIIQVNLLKATNAAVVIPKNSTILTNGVGLIHLRITQIRSAVRMITHQD
jgi:hypothetical protein